MLINFGDNRNGNGAEEPANQEGSLASSEIYIPEELKTPEPTSEKAVETPKAVEKPAEKIITGTWTMPKSSTLPIPTQNADPWIISA